MRYLDDITKKYLNEGFEESINLGGGYDTRALGIPGMDSAAYFHVDQPDVLADFKQRQSNVGPAHTVDIRYVPIDFNTESLVQTLGGAGYYPGKKTLFLWEGVT